MLVYLAIPKGIAMCSGKRVHGYAEYFEPTYLRWDEYKGNAEALVEAPFTPEYLSKRFEKKFPLELRFTLSELKHLDYSILQVIATFLNIKGKVPKVNLITLIRNELRDI